MKNKILCFLITAFFSFSASAQIWNPGSGAGVPAGPNGSSGYYNNNGAWGYLYGITFQGLSGVVGQFSQAATELYLITQGMEVDPRYYGASCMASYFGNFNGLTNTITITSGSPVISIAGYTFNPAIAGPGYGGDVGKVVSIMSGSCDTGITTYIASVDTNANTATLGASIGGSGCTHASSLVMGGYPSDYATPSLAQDDTLAIENASSSAVQYHGGRQVLPDGCLVHVLDLAVGTKLQGNNAGNNYGAARGYNRFISDTPTTMYCASDSLADDPTQVCINMHAHVELKDFTLQCGSFPYLGYYGQTLAGIGTTVAKGIDSESFVMDHMSVLQCPVGLGVPFGLNQAVTFTASISGTTMTVASIDSAIFPGAPTGGATTGWLAVGRKVTGAGVTANTVITAAPPPGTAGTYTVNNSQTVSSESMTSAATVNQFETTSRFSSFVTNGIGINGALSDNVEVEDVFTGNYGPGQYMGPGSEGANRIIGGRFEENGTTSNQDAFICDGCAGIQFTGTQFQFNAQGAIGLLGTWGNVLVTGGMFEGNGSLQSAANDKAQIHIGGSGSNLSINGTQFMKSNFSGGGTANYILETTVASGVDYVGLEGGDVRSGYNIGVFSPANAVPAHYRQDAMGIPTLDSTVAVTASGCSYSALTGSAYAGQFKAGTSSLCTITLTLPTAPNGWICSGNDITAGAAFPQSASATTSCALTGTPTTNDIISFTARAY